MTADQQAVVAFFGLLGAAFLAILALIARAENDRPTPPNDGSDR